MSTRIRALIGVSFLLCGLTAQAALERSMATTRPALSAPLDSVPLTLGGWIGRDEPMDPDVLRETQATDHLNRVYEHPDHPNQPLTLWINYSSTGMNLRHSPEVCLPSGGWTKVEAQCRTLDVDRGRSKPPTRIMKLAYSQRDLAQNIGFWYYIFGEGQVERYVRSLPITSRSSHGRTTRGSGLTVEIFGAGESDPDGTALRDFAAVVLDHLERLMPEDRAPYHIP